MTTVFLVLGWFPGWPTVAVYLGLYAVATVLVVRWSRRPGWSRRHVFALAGGALATYAWYAFPSQPLVGAGGPVDVAGNVVFAVGLAGLLWQAARVAGTSAETAPPRLLWQAARVAGTSAETAPPGSGAGRDHHR